jgi:hypothetical protein
MKYNVGDRVLVKSIDWYNENKDKYGFVDFSTSVFVPGMSQFCGKIVTIEDVFEEDDVVYCMEGIDYDWTDEMIEGLAEEVNTLKIQSNDMETETHRGYYTTEEETANKSKKIAWFSFRDNDFADKVELDLSNRELIQEDGKWFVVKKKKGYPKTYEECCEVLVGRKPNPNEISFGKMELCLVDLDNTQSIYFQNPYLPQFNSLFRLRMCRDAYWKIAGEEMGLEKPWEPDWTNYNEYKFVIGVNENKIIKCYNTIAQFVLAFPTEEMRDAFYEAFEKEIKICKELL